MLALSHEMITATAVEAPKDVPQDPITVRTADNAPQPQDLTITVRTADNAPQVLLSVSVPVPDQGKCTTTSTVHLPTSIVKKKRTLRKKGQSHSQSNIYNCGTCFKLCLEVEDITQPDQESVGCDKCGVWFHCICVNFKDVSASKWYCPPCIIL
ncbi:hypothetical protein V1264_005636 [Littorina saxatilis]|uniref:PHD-type domain-containing protein n=2 Tax=Littorina saxatilis TaxID=31220 RepID=A0AAN9G640_9CAEN